MVATIEADSQLVQVAVGAARDSMAGSEPRGAVAEAGGYEPSTRGEAAGAGEGEVDNWVVEGDSAWEGDLIVVAATSY